MLKTGFLSRVNSSFPESWFKIQYSLTKNVVRSTNTLSICKKDVSKETLPAAYKPTEIEDGWYEWWESTGYFKPAPNAKPVFSLLLPPPNVTGTLHLGHALTGTIQDVIIRWRRMRGESVLWIPGVDHAGIATQVVVEKYILNELKKSKHDLGREQFVDQVWKWKEDKGRRIIEQLRGLGLSLDWSRHVFTMDPVPSEAVKTAFIHLFDTGLIYRADGLVNWSCALQSSISDIEVDMKQISMPTLLKLPGCQEPIEFGVLSRIAYKVYNGDSEIVVATTRPETMLGDTAVALHPDDPRRPELEGKSVWHPFRNRPIPIIFDSFVDPALGTGAVKITPAHDAIDWEVGKRHNLETVRVFDESGKIVTSKFKGKHRLEARKMVVGQLKNIGLFRGTQDHAMLIPVCSRSGDVVELMPKPQWFLNCNLAAIRAIHAVKSGDLKLEPKNYENVWYNWLENIKDWNISRQLWWGHRIPAYEVSVRGKEKKTWVAANTIEEAAKKAVNMLGVAAENLEIQPDPDVLDTWFSSGLFPLYSLGWPQCDSEFRERFPFPLLETGNDIIFFWVARMVMMSIMLTGSLPFEKVVLHGVVCDARGRKMSKSLGNVVAPEDVVRGASLDQLASAVQDSHRRGLLSDAEVQTSLSGQKKLFPTGIPVCGVDALRFTLCSQAIQSANISFDVPTCHTNKLFCNKILQAFKFSLLSLEKESVLPSFHPQPANMSCFDKWIISRIAATVVEVNTSLEEVQLHVATAALKQFLYAEFCDVYLEAVKPILRFGEEPARQAILSSLFCCLDTALRLMHPFMPFLSEELYQRLPALHGFKTAESVMIAEYPVSAQWSSSRDPELEAVVSRGQDVVSAVRKLKALFGTKGVKPEVIVVTDDSELAGFLEKNIMSVKTLARASIFTIQTTLDPQLIDAASLLKEVLNERTTVYANVQTEAKARTERLEPILKREQKVREQLQELEALIAYGGKQRKVSPERIERSVNKLKALQLQLDKILEIKKLFLEKR